MAKLHIRKTAWRDAIAKSGKIRKNTVWLPVLDGDHFRANNVWHLLGGVPAPRVWEIGGVYDTGTGAQVWKYRPPAVPGVSLPLIISVAGQGQTGTDPALMLGDGFPKVINEGFDFSRCQLIAPQLPSGSWTSARIKQAYDWALANMEVDVQQVYIYGISIGAEGAASFCLDFPGLVHAAALFSSFPNAINAGNVATVQGIPFLFCHSYAEASVPPGGSTFINMNAITGTVTPPRFAPLCYMPWIEQHDVQPYPWMRYMVEPASAIISVEKDFFLLHSNDKLEEANNYVDRAQSTQRLLDITSAFSVANKLPAGPDRTALLSVLTALHAGLVDRHFLINFGSAEALAEVNINNLPNCAAGQSVLLADTENAASPYTLSIISAASTPQENTSLSAEIFGLPRGMVQSSLVTLPDATTALELSDLDENKFYDLEFICSDKSEDLTATGRLRGIKINANNTAFMRSVVTPGWNGLNTVRLFNVKPTAGGIISIQITPNSLSYTDPYKGNVNGLIVKEKAATSESRVLTGKFNPCLDAAGSHPDWGSLLDNPVTGVRTAVDPVSGWELSTVATGLWENYFSFWANNEEAPAGTYPPIFPPVVARSAFFNLNKYMDQAAPNHNLKITGPGGTLLPEGEYVLYYFGATGNSTFGGRTDVYCLANGSGWQYQSFKALNNTADVIAFNIRIGSTGSNIMLSCYAPNVFDASFLNAVMLIKVK